jgi:hypothetical protein
MRFVCSEWLGWQMGFQLRGASVYIRPTVTPRDGFVDGCLARSMSRATAVIHTRL